MSKTPEVQRLNSQDEYFLDTDVPTAPTHIGGLEIYEPPKGAGKDFVRQLFESFKRSPVRAEPFNYKLDTIEPEEKPSGWLGSLQRKRKKPTPVRVWKKLEKVNVEEHLHLHALPMPGGQRELGELVARLHVNRLDRHRPLWEVHLIDGLEGGRYAVYTKLHHSQFDGKRGMSLNRLVRSPDPKKRGIPPVWSVVLDAAKPSGDKPATTKAEPGKLQTIAGWGKAVRSMADVRAGRRGVDVVAPYTAPASILNGPLTARRRIGTQSLSLARMRAIGEAVQGGATVNEILLAICGGALRRYLLDREALPDKPLIAACPVAMARKEEGASGNAVGQILVSLGTHIASPRQRLAEVVRSSRANKGLMKDLDSDVYQSYTHLSMLPQILAGKAGIGHKVLNANLVISNVPGPPETQYVNGARVEAMYSTSLLLPGQALNITVCTFGGHMDMGILACPDLCPSPQRIAVYAGEEIGLLEEALGLPPPEGTARRAPRAAKRTAKRAAARPVRRAAVRKAPAKAAKATAKTPAKKAPARKTTPPKAAAKRSSKRPAKARH